MRFRKIHGAGNDFVLLADPTPDGGKDWPKEAERLCARRTGVGADGLVISSLISISPVVFEVGCFNADGSIATMCGNALRCTAWAAHHDHGFREMNLRMAGVMHEAIVSDDSVWVTAEVGAVPDLLDERQQELLVQPIGIRGTLERQVGSEVDAAVEQVLEKITINDVVQRLKPCGAAVTSKTVEKNGKKKHYDQKQLALPDLRAGAKSRRARAVRTA